MSKRIRHLVPLVALLVVLLAFPRRSRAENAYILAVEGGAGGFEAVTGVFQARLGWGGNDKWTGFGFDSDGVPLLFGVLATSLTRYSVGTDVALLGRMAFGLYPYGGFGVAIDVGPYVRLNEPHSVGVLGEVIVGFPWGPQLSLWGEYGTLDNRAIGATVGVDLARFASYAIGRIVVGATGP